MNQKLYSVLTIKSIDDDQRIIEGIASTPATDRQEDIVEPKGARYTLPLPFLMQHGKNGIEDSVGEVFFAKVTALGIEIKAQIKRDPVLPELDKAWARIKLGLVRGLSIGFQPVKSEPIKGSFGTRFLSWDWLELSGVVIPANQEALITTIKSIDQQQRAASGHTLSRPVRLIHSPGASGKQLAAMRGAVKLIPRKR